MLAGHTDAHHWWYTVLFVWDHRLERAVVYMPGPSDLGYRVNYGVDTSYAQRAGKWFVPTDQIWTATIRENLPQHALGVE